MNAAPVSGSDRTHPGRRRWAAAAALAFMAGLALVLLFMLTEADGIFRRMLGLQPDALASPAAGATEGLLLAEQVVKAPRWKKVRGSSA